MKLREKIEAAALEVYGSAAKKQARELADRILAIPEIAEALNKAEGHG